MSTKSLKKIRILFSTVFFCFSSIMGYSQACTGSNPNLVVNGDFESCTGACPTNLPVRLDTEFPDYSPDYSTVDCNGGGPSHAMGGGRYAIVNDASACFSGWWSAASGNAVHGGSYAMLLDGSSTTNTDAWCQTVSVVSGTKYQFTAFLQNPWNNNTDIGSDGFTDLPQVQLTVNGVPISSLVAVPTVFGGWDQNNCVYQATSTGSVSICIQMNTTGSSIGNDLMIDDISFKAVSTCPAGTCGYTGTVLPLTLLSFEAKESNYKALLQWTTTQEENVYQFVIEKSLDGKNFVPIGTVKANAPYYNAVQHYEFYDEHFTKTAYYKLIIADIDGTIYRSEIKKVSKSGDRVIFGRTASGEMEVKAIVNSDTNWHIARYTLLGQEKENRTMALKEGENSLLKSSAESINPEVLRITTQEGEVIFSEVISW